MNVPKGVCVYRKAERHRAILAALARGCTSPQIADSLGFTRNTLRIYMSELLLELGARTRAHAVIVAMERGWIDPPRTR